MANGFGMSDDEYEQLQRMLRAQIYGSMFGSFTKETTPAAPVPLSPPSLFLNRINEKPYEPKWDAKVQTGALVAAGYRPFNVKGLGRMWAKSEDELYRRYGRTGKPLPLDGAQVRRQDVVVLDEQDGGSEMITSVSEA